MNQKMEYLRNGVRYCLLLILLVLAFATGAHAAQDDYYYPNYDASANGCVDLMNYVKRVTVTVNGVDYTLNQLDQMRQQAALLKTRRSRRSLAWQTGCAQLAGRMVQEVTALGMMDSFGRVSEENKKRLDTLDSAQEISLPENSLQVPAADSVQDTVMNYHIACYCQAYAYLTQLLPLWKDEEPEQAAKQGEETSNEKARQGSITAGAD